jgi:hypothetical protein
MSKPDPLVDNTVRKSKTSAVGMSIASATGSSRPGVMQKYYKGFINLADQARTASVLPLPARPANAFVHK